VRRAITGLFILLAQGYGPRLSLREVAEILHISLSQAQKLAASGELGVPMYKDGGQWFADIRHVGEYLGRS
jgi:hypothetical protein